MKRPNLGLMLAVAAASGLSPLYGAKVPLLVGPSVQAPGPRVGGMTAPQGGIGTLLNAIQAVGGGTYGRPPRPRFKKQGWSVAEGRRRARRRRNQLRAKGRYRQAVR